MIQPVLVLVAIDQSGVQAVPVVAIAAGLQDPVDDVQAEARIAEPGFLVQERLSRNAADVPLLADRRRQLGRVDADELGVFRDLVLHGFGR